MNTTRRTIALIGAALALAVIALTAGPLTHGTISPAALDRITGHTDCRVADGTVVATGPPNATCETTP